MAIKRIMNLPPIEFEAETTDGTVILLKARNMKMSEYVKIDDFDKDSDKTMILSKKLAYIFGGKPEDYNVFDARMAILIFNSYLEQIRNPTVQS